MMTELLANILVGGLVGIGAGVLAARIYARAAFRVKPSISIAQTIAQTRSGDGGDEYTIKVINLDPRYPAIHLQARLYLVRPFAVPKGEIGEYTEVVLKRQEIFTLDPIKKGQETEERFGWRFVTYKPLLKRTPTGHEPFVEDELKIGKLVFVLSATHGLTGSVQVFERKFDLRTDVRLGDYPKGPSLEVLGPNP